LLKINTRDKALAKVVIYPKQLDEYKAVLKEQAETSVLIEPRVLTLFAVQFIFTNLESMHTLLGTELVLQTLLYSI
jgi:hypothetical protein